MGEPGENEAAWPKALEESFSAEPAGWSFAATTDPVPALQFDAPGFVVTLPGGETSVAAYWYEQRQFSDLSVSVTLTLLTAQEPQQSYMGVSFRAASDKDNYRLFLDGDGYYRLTRRVNNVSTALVDWTRHEAIVPGFGQDNKIEIIAKGPEITVKANGEVITTVTDDAFTTGHVALQAQGGSAESESATRFSFKDLVISAPE